MLVQLIARLIYHSYDDLLDLWDGGFSCLRENLLQLLTISVLKGLCVGGAATGISALVFQGKKYELLRKSIDTDVERIETFVSHLQESLTLSELVLQNRRGLDRSNFTQALFGAHMAYYGLLWMLDAEGSELRLQ